MGKSSKHEPNGVWTIERLILSKRHKCKYTLLDGENAYRMHDDGNGGATLELLGTYKLDVANETRKPDPFESEDSDCKSALDELVRESEKLGLGWEVRGMYEGDVGHRQKLIVGQTNASEAMSAAAQFLYSDEYRLQPTCDGTVFVHASLGQFGTWQATVTWNTDSPRALWRGHMDGWKGYEAGLDVRILADDVVEFRETGTWTWEKADDSTSSWAYKQAFLETAKR